MVLWTLNTGLRMPQHGDISSARVESGAIVLKKASITQFRPFFSKLLRISLLLIIELLMCSSVSAQEAEPDAEDSSSQPHVTIERVATDFRNRYLREMQLVAEQLPLAEIHWLNAEGLEFLSALEVAESSAIKGNVIIVPSQSQHAVWPTTVKPLQTRLASGGWSVITITPIRLPPLMYPRSAQDAMADDGNEMEESMADKPMMAEKPIAEDDKAMMIKDDKAIESLDLSNVLDAQLDAALELIQQTNPAKVVLVGIGDGAVWATRYAQKLIERNRTQNPVLALVLIDAENSVVRMHKSGDMMIDKSRMLDKSDATDAAMMENAMVDKPEMTDKSGMMAGDNARKVALFERVEKADLVTALNAPAPVLDIYHRSGTANIAAKLRKTTAIRNGYERYVQQALPDAPENPEFLANRVLGFINRTVQ
ncbi:DUF3530 family protein [Sessilibacter sp. MAH4]